MASHAVVIGAATYESDSIRSYDTIERSARKIDCLLQQSPLWGPGNCQLVVNPRPHQVIDAIAGADQEVSGDGTLLVYYIGHGEYWLDSTPHDVYLALGSSVSRQEWSFLGCRYVYRAMRSSTAARKILILDCCNAGMVDGSLGGPVSPQWMEEVERHGGTCVLSATRRDSPNQNADASDEEHWYTAFSGCLVGILEAGIEDGPHDLTVLDIYDELNTQLHRDNRPRPELISRAHGFRTPVYRNKRPSQHPRPPEYARLRSLSAADLAEAWTGREPIPGLTPQTIEDYLPEFVAEAAPADAARLLHDVNGLGRGYVELWTREVLRSLPERVGHIVAALRGHDCADCEAVARSIQDESSKRLAPSELIAYRRGLHCGGQQ